MLNKNKDVHGQVFTTLLEEPKKASKPAPGQQQILKREAAENDDKTELEGIDKGPLKLEAKIVNFQSPSLFYVILLYQQKYFFDLYNKIQHYYLKNKSQSKEKWEVGDRCCTVCSASQTWRRAVIVELEGTNAKVFYTDFACVETIPIATLKDLAPEFMGVGDAAIKCHLSGFEPADDDKDEYPTVTREYFKELLDTYPRIFITKVGSFKNKSMPIEIWVYHTIQGGALEPNQFEWRCLNKKILQPELAVPDRNHCFVQ